MEYSQIILLAWIGWKSYVAKLRDIADYADLQKHVVGLKLVIQFFSFSP